MDGSLWRCHLIRAERDPGGTIKGEVVENCKRKTHLVIRLFLGSTWRVISDSTSFSELVALSLYSCERENWIEGGCWD